MRKIIVVSAVFFSIFVINSCNKEPNTSNDIKDIDGNIYNTIRIGSQVWMKENLRTTKYNDGESIPFVPDYADWAGYPTPGYCWYMNDSPSSKKEYGAMYNWYAVNTDRLCPTGWHVASEEEWAILTDYLGGLSVAGGKLKEAGTLHWNAPNADATNESQFTGLPGGYRSFRDGAYFSIKNNGTWWSSSSNTSSSAWLIAITLYNTSDVQVVSGDKKYGVSVRCLKN
jgi:uncharacterized protein (TIGR02145 family)